MKDLATTLIESVHANRHLLAEAYQQGSVARTEENQKALHALHQRRILVPCSPDEFRIHSSLRKFFDAALSTQKLLHRSEDVGKIFADLDFLCTRYIDAFHESAGQGLEQHRDEILEAVFEIADAYHAHITNLQSSIATRFAAVSSLSAKRKQNEFYIQTTQKLVDAITTINFSDLEERMAFDPEAQQIIRQQLLARLPAFLSQLQQILDVLHRFLFEFRKIEARAKRVHQMWIFLRRNADYQPQDWDNAPDLPDWLCRAPAMEFKAHVDTNDERCATPLIEIAKALPPSSAAMPRKREAGALDQESPMEELVHEPPPHLRAIRTMLMQARKSPEPFSAIAWRREHAIDAGLNERLWLEILLELLTKKARLTKGVRHVFVERPPEPPFNTGNVDIQDILVGR